MLLSLYLALGNANTIASESVGAIVNLLDSPKQTNIFLNDLLTALGAGLGIIPGPEGKIAQVILASAQQAPGVGKYLFPTGTVNTVVDQRASIANQVGTVVKTYQNSIADMIPATITAFLAFASTGAFSINPLPDLSEQSDAPPHIHHRDANNIHITRAIDTDIN